MAEALVGTERRRIEFLFTLNVNICKLGPCKRTA
jgi:hypothetical protein